MVALALFNSPFSSVACNCIDKFNPLLLSSAALLAVSAAAAAAAVSCWWQRWHGRELSDEEALESLSSVNRDALAAVSGVRRF